jgi:nitrate/nitrite transport system ATP-binding protein
MTDKFISIEGIAKRYPAQATPTIFEDLWLSMPRGEFGCVIGHSGCGKTTVLNILAGLDEPTEGAVIVDGQAIEGTSLDRAVIFQSHALLPWRTVMGNVAYAVSSKWRKWDKARVRACAEIHRYRWPHRLEHKRPSELSGGMKQRVGIARALDHAKDHADGRTVLGAGCADARHAAGRSPPHLSGDRPDRFHDHA